MFGGGMLGLLVALLVLSVLSRQASLFVLAVALLAAAGLSRVWERHCLSRIEYRRSFSRRRVPFGEQIEMEIEVVNRKPLPLSWLEIDDEVPAELAPSRGCVRAAHKPGRFLLSNLLAFRPYERVRRRYTIHCKARGEHVFGPVRLRSGDLFGFVTCEQVVDLLDTVVVYPRIADLSELGLVARQPLGDWRVRSWLFEDVSRAAGTRDYRPTDGLRRIHWPASARLQRLQAKVFEATTGHRLAVFLNLAAEEGYWWGQRYDPDVLELAITVAASLANWGLERGYQVGLYANGMHRWSWARVAVEPGSDPSQLERLLTALARLMPFAARRFGDLLAEESRRLAFGTSVVLVSASLTRQDIAGALALRARGHGVTAILTGRQPPPEGLRGIAVRRVGPPEAWRDATALSAAGD